MIAQTVAFRELSNQGRWKVEFFTAELSTFRSAVFPIVKLRDVFGERKETIDPQQFGDHQLNYLGLEHVRSVTGELVEPYQPRLGSAVLSRSKVFRDEDLLYGRLRPSLNKVFVAEGETVPEGICSGEFYVLIPDRGRLLPRFARELLASAYVQEVVRGMTTGSALPRLQLDDLLDIEVPLPPTEVQRRYEQELLARIRRRRQIAIELERGPGTELNALVAWLEGGPEPQGGEFKQVSAPTFHSIRLPAAIGGPSKKRGRPARSMPLFETP